MKWLTTWASLVMMDLLIVHDGRLAAGCAEGNEVRLPQDTLISDQKLVRYLLAPRKRNDKSKWLAKAGYCQENWPILREDLRSQILSQEATLVESTDYGTMYSIKGTLKGPNGKSLAVCTIWMLEKTTKATKFVTMYPDRKRGQDDV